MDEPPLEPRFAMVKRISILCCLVVAVSGALTVLAGGVDRYLSIDRNSQALLGHEARLVSLEARFATIDGKLDLLLDQRRHPKE